MIDSVGEFDGNFKRIFWVCIIIILVFCLFYFITVMITGKEKDNSKNVVTDSSISYTEIMAGRSFSMPENEYLVLYYDKSNSDYLTTYSTAVSSYRAKGENLTIYTVDMSGALNKGYVSEESNTSPQSVSDLKVSGPTLIHFKDGVVLQYLEGEENITNYLG